MNDVVSKSIKYVSGSTTVYTSAQKSIEQGKGVCQDFAHILISLARFYGFPARYINGFLFEEVIHLRIQHMLGLRFSLLI